jgi:hypothetical protein
MLCVFPLEVAANSTNDIISICRLLTPLSSGVSTVLLEADNNSDFSLYANTCRAVSSKPDSK